MALAVLPFPAEALGSAGSPGRLQSQGIPAGKDGCAADAREHQREGETTEERAERGKRLLCARAEMGVRNISCKLYQLLREKCLGSRWKCRV